jgi:ABC-type transport system substrate-binding protein
LKNQDDFGKYCYGTGPFKLVDFVPGEKVVLEKFADYWGAPAKVDRVEFIVLKDELTRLTALETGEIDMCFKVSPTYVNRLKGKGFNVVSAPNSRLLYLNLNVRKAPFKDLRCRQALAYAIDYDKIVKEIFLGMVEPAYGSISVHQSFPFAVPEPPYKYDPEKAKKLLAEAGYPNGVDVTFWGSSGRYTNMKEVQEAIAAYLSAVGFRVKFQMFEWGSYVSIVNAQVGEVWNGIRETVEYDIAFLGWALSTPDVSYNSGYQTTKQSFNWATWSNDRVDQLYMQGVTTTSPEERAKIYKEIQDILAKELPFVWLYTEPWLNALKPGVTGMIFMPMESYYYFDIDKK